MVQDASIYLAGKKLYGDDFTQEQIEEWFKHEAEGYADLWASDYEKYNYAYHKLNAYYGFRHLANHSMRTALGIGSAYGDELFPIAKRLEKITILDPSDTFADVREIAGTPSQYVKPNVQGDMPFEDAEFDLITSFGVLHHIPNVSYVVRECFRCLRPGGIFLLREPMVSMGDWTKPRPGLTKHERGIPLKILRQIVQEAGFEIQQEALCMFSATSAIASKLRIDPYNSRVATLADSALSRVFAWNDRYHRVKLREKFGPTSVYYVLRKPG
ncbi:class I SAM-dependent methyltransferase [filamentous cyanobacterium LEGE 11480]|uniref:Class I SAM-dependent methyltransferase n=1 Tax=Romeriopsis navalis LEGE 11480 TaxID=2777977 RepID=A0A928Z326_9CYAN|nr:class I SAM-dependent methyltransferase [Romeriopsis navalis]MBE9028910.1 class I SAM-dependent methyltransferase [Romeriopsis navalis LEGE 11480]